MTREEFQIFCNKQQCLYVAIKERLKHKEVINVGFLVVDDNAFSYHNIIRELQKDARFVISIFVIPMITKSKEHIAYTLQKTFNNLSKRYSNVHYGYDFATNSFIDIAPFVDIAFFSNPYDFGVNPLHQIQYLSNTALCAYIPYAYTGKVNYDLGVFQSLEYSLLWRVYAENHNVQSLINQYQLAKVNNVETIGYPKMDNLYNLKKSSCGGGGFSKSIIIAPHHTITEWTGLQLSNFLRYSDFFLKLPELYPDIYFIFRPHPLLSDVLRQNPNLWNETWENYLDKISKIPNMTYDNSSDYFQTFVDSDALIHDCGSFISEYLYTDNPMCFMGRNDVFDKTFTEFGAEILKYVYVAFQEQEILNFINKVVVGGKDTMRKKRIQYAKNTIRFNYPNASAALIKNLKKEIFGE